MAVLADRVGQPGGRRALEGAGAFLEVPPEVAPRIGDAEQVDLLGLVLADIADDQPVAVEAVAERIPQTERIDIGVAAAARERIARGHRDDARRD